MSGVCSVADKDDKVLVFQAFSVNEESEDSDIGVDRQNNVNAHDVSAPTCQYCKPHEFYRTLCVVSCVDCTTYVFLSLKACQRHRDYYRGVAKAHHPLIYFKEQDYLWQCPPDMTPTYLSFPMYHVKYKQPIVLPSEIGRTSGFPALPDRTLAGRFNKAACKAFMR